MPAQENASDRRSKAIKKYQDRIEAANQKAIEREAGIRAEEERRQKLYEDWPRIADGIIANAVNATSDDFVQRGSPIFLTPVSAPANSGARRQSESTMQVQLATAPRSFEVRQKGQTHPMARLQFEVNISTAKISVTTTAQGAELPLPILLNEFEPQWAAQAAEAVLLAILEN